MKSIAVFFGGQSTEHDVSCITGTLTVNAVDYCKYSVIPVYVSRDGEWYTGEVLKDIAFYKSPDLKKLTRVTIIGGDNALYAVKRGKLKKIDNIACAINCMHGERGEDGALYGVLSLSGIAVVGSGITASGIAIDKIATKQALFGIKVKTLPFVVADSENAFKKAEKTLGYPMIVKPVTQGSSIGVNKVMDRKQLEKSVLKAKKFDDRVMIEKCAQNFFEINVGVYRGEKGVNVSLCEMPKTENGFLTFEDKYVAGEREFPAPISDILSDKIRKTAKKIYEELNFSGVIRIDFIVSGGEIFVNEINSVPGSMAYYLFYENLKGYTYMLSDMIDCALMQANKKSTLIKKFDCSVLEIKSAKGGKRL